MIKYLCEIMPDQRIIYTTGTPPSTFVSPVIHVIEMDEGVQWGCVYPPKRHTIWHDKKPVHVFVEGRGFMAVSRIGDSSSWIKMPDTDEAYVRALMSLGITYQDFMFTRESKQQHAEPHVNPIPEVRHREPLPVYSPGLHMTPNLALLCMCDDQDMDDNPAFYTQEKRDMAIKSIQAVYPRASIATGKCIIRNEGEPAHVGYFVTAVDGPTKKRRKK